MRKTLVSLAVGVALELFCPAAATAAGALDFGATGFGVGAVVAPEAMPAARRKDRKIKLRFIALQGSYDIPVTQATAKSTDLDARTVNSLDLSSLITTLGTWTVEVIQRTGSYPDDHIGSATFTVVSNTNNNITSVNINTELGSLK